MFTCHHGNKDTCFQCNKENKKASNFGIKAGTTEKLSELPILKIFKTEKAAQNYCNKMNDLNDGKYYTYILIAK